MYMEAYGNVGSVADSIIKQSAHTLIGMKMAKEVAKETKAPEQGVQWSEESANSDVGVPSRGGGVGSMADPNTVRDMNAVSRQKAMESLQQKIDDLEGRRLYLEETLGKVEERNKDLENRLGKRLLRK